MNVAEQLEQGISDPMSWSQICDRYPHQWVCVVDMRWDEPRAFHFRAARVVGHGTTRLEPLVQARAWRAQYDEIGHFFTGRIVAPFPRFYA
jgi:hypothetical protein